MKIKVNNEEIFEIKSWEIKLLEDSLMSETLEEDLKRRLEWVIYHKIDQCYQRFEKEWLDKLRKDPSVSTIPTDKKAFVEMVTARSDYKNRSQRESESS